MAETFNVVLTLYRVDCICGAVFAIPSGLYHCAKQNGSKAIYCPICKDGFVFKEGYKQEMDRLTIRLGQKDALLSKHEATSLRATNLIARLQKQLAALPATHQKAARAR